MEILDEYYRQNNFLVVEKVTVLARLLKIEAILNNQVIMTSLAHAFCYLIGCLNDVNTSVVQRTTLYLETIKDSALKVLLKCALQLISRWPEAWKIQCMASHMWKSIGIQILVTLDLVLIFAFNHSQNVS